ncbi:MAG: hypothetical protein ACRDE7_00885 [Sphingobacterium sp.]
MKFGKIFIIVMAVLVLTKPFFPILFYCANMDYIKEYFCINQDKPMLHCDGTCYLAKKIAEAKKKQQSERVPTDNTDNKMVQVDWVVSFNFNFPNLILQDTPTQQNLSIAFNPVFLDNLYHPPQSV